MYMVSSPPFPVPRCATSRILNDENLKKTIEAGLVRALSEQAVPWGKTSTPRVSG